MSNTPSSNDPLDFTRKLWSQMGSSLPGMVTPTFDVEELEKRLAELKTVEGWLKMNLSMLQLTIQGLEMQCTTLRAVRDIANVPAAQPAAASNKAAETPKSTADGQPGGLQSAMWPWALMQQIQAQMQEAAEAQLKPPPAQKDR